LKVVTPSIPADAKALLKTAIRDDNPVVFLQAAGRGGESGEVPDGEALLPLGEAALRREGSDVTVVAFGNMARNALKAAEACASDGVSVEVVDPRTLVPLDVETILASVRKTGRLVVVDEARDACSAASQIAAIAADQAFGDLRAPIRRVTVDNVAMPYSPPLEQAVLPSVERIMDAIRSVTEYKGKKQ
ncbi:MAG: alpha-ketoacid dehydrogenase subunit beta, partial [Parvibaculaceae bacterium]